MTNVLGELDDMSLMERIALLPRDERDRVITGLTDAELSDPRVWLRPKQQKVMDDPSPIVVVASGRGSGKTRIGSSWTIEKARRPGTRIHLVGRTVADVRDVMVQGDSGILSISPPDFKPEYVPSVRRLMWPNGSMAITHSSETADSLRGPQADATWADEAGTFKTKPDSSGATTWDNILLSTRLGSHPQILVTTTPRRTRIIKELFADAKSAPDRVSLHIGSTLDNRANLAPEYLANIIAMYDGTPLAAQEIYGELLDEVAGAMWRDTDFVYEPADRDLLPELVTVIGVDPGLTTGGDSTGIVTVRGTTDRLLTDRRAWVARDDTESGGGVSPDRWAARVVAVWREETALCRRPAIVVAEKNAGGELVSTVIRQTEGGTEIPIALVHAKGSKMARAEPVLLAYRRGRVLHEDVLPELEDEMTSYEESSGWSPNRLDAAVHALRALLVNDEALRRFGSLFAVRPSVEFGTSAFRGGDRARGGMRAPHREERGPVAQPIDAGSRFDLPVTDWQPRRET